MIEGFVVNQHENFVTIKQDSNYEWSDGEELELESLKGSFFRKLRKLFFCLLTWVIKSGNIYKLGVDSARFRPGQSPAMQKEMLYYLIRWRIGYLKIGYNRQGLPQSEPKSLSDDDINDRVMNDVYTNAFQFFANRMDMTPYIKEYEDALRKAGRLV